MKLVHKKQLSSEAESGEEANELVQARQLEKEGANAEAIVLYEKAIKKYPLQANLYDRLMILYRKEKEYKKELALINAAVKKFGESRQPKQQPTKKVSSLSKSILHAVGLADKKGKSLYTPEPMAKWEKRKKTVQRKLHGNKK